LVYIVVVFLEIRDVKLEKEGPGEEEQGHGGKTQVTRRKIKCKKKHIKVPRETGKNEYPNKEGS